MKVLFDTSVLIAAIVEAHPRHPESLLWLRKCQEGEISLLVSSHTLAELYAVLTALPVRPKITPAVALRIIENDVIKLADVITLNKSEYIAVLRQMATLGLAGGKIYDALIARTAVKAEASKLLTLNKEHFVSVFPDIKHILETPKMDY